MNNTGNTPAPKVIENTLLEAINHLLIHHPQLVQPLITMALKKIGKDPVDVNLLLELNKDLLSKSNSQLRQDIFVLHELGFKRQGYFVEFGATNGVDLSNTYLLEKHYEWQGIVAEPAKLWHEDLKNNRRCRIETNCVWKVSGETLVFNEVEKPELSTISDYSFTDLHSEKRKSGKAEKIMRFQPFH